MNIVRVTLAAVALAMPLAPLTSPAQAASAHNSQAGANGPTTNAEASTGRHFRSTKRVHRTKGM